jgi:cation transporter-like permease
MKETSPSPFSSFSSLRIGEEECVDDGNINSSKNYDDNDNDYYDFLHSDRRMERSRSVDDTVSGSDNKDVITSELERENERLRSELLMMQNKLARVKSKLKEQRNHPHQYQVSGSSQQRHHATPLPSLNEIVTTASGGVLLEWPIPLRSMAQKNGVSMKATDAHEIPMEISNDNAKDHHSVSTTDERNTVESYIDLEAHQSGAGLHHRGGDMKNRKVQAINTPTHTLKTSQTADDSLSSSDSYDDEETERLVEAHANMGTNRATQHETTMMERPRPDIAGDPLKRSFCNAIVDRAGWLVGLLVFQSLSSFILARNESLLQHHAVIVQFLTMLVGAGGNAGNQASVGVVRGIAVGTIDRSNVRRFLGREFAMGLALSIILGTAGFVRAAVFAIPWLETLAITSSLFMIVFISVVTGALLPLGMYLVGIDPAHSSTTIQVIMDITGVVITVHVSSLVLDTDFRQWLENIIQMNGET